MGKIGQLLKLFGLSKLEELKKKHAVVRSQIDWWIDEVRAAQWKNPQSIKERHRSADFLHDNRVIFNVKGNQYRIVAAINYAKQSVAVEWVGTHAEYSKRRF